MLSGAAQLHLGMIVVIETVPGSGQCALAVCLQLFVLVQVSFVLLIHAHAVVSARNVHIFGLHCIARTVLSGVIHHSFSRRHRRVRRSALMTDKVSGWHVAIDERGKEGRKYFPRVHLHALGQGKN